MTKQEEIGELIDKVIQNWNPANAISTDWQPLYGGVTVGQDIQLGLHSKGVVIKVDRELPKLLVDANKAQTVRDTKEMMLKAGYVVVEPLVKEE